MLCFDPLIRLMNGCINGKSNLTQNRLGFVERQNMGLHGLEKNLRFMAP